MAFGMLLPIELACTTIIAAPETSTRITPIMTNFTIALSIATFFCATASESQRTFPIGFHSQSDANAAPTIITCPIVPGYLEAASGIDIKFCVCSVAGPVETFVPTPTPNVNALSTTWPSTAERTLVDTV